MLIGRLATDPGLRRRFEGGAPALLRELASQEYELSSIEIDALATIDPVSMRAFAETIDARLRRADHHVPVNHPHD
jgi:hypothetical protein